MRCKSYNGVPAVLLMKPVLMVVQEEAAASLEAAVGAQQQWETGRLLEIQTSTDEPVFYRGTISTVTVALCAVSEPVAGKLTLIITRQFDEHRADTNSHTSSGEDVSRESFGSMTYEMDVSLNPETGIICMAVLNTRRTGVVTVGAALKDSTCPLQVVRSYPVITPWERGYVVG